MVSVHSKKRGKWRRPAVELHNINFLFTYDITPSLLFNAVVPLHTVAIQFGRKQVWTVVSPVPLPLTASYVTMSPVIEDVHAEDESVPPTIYS